MNCSREPSPTSLLLPHRCLLSSPDRSAGGSSPRRQIGGSTRYVVTNGDSMEPLFHSGDLALVRPAGQYKVGDIVAYWSTLLHTVVLHRIVRDRWQHTTPSRVITTTSSIPPIPRAPSCSANCGCTCPGGGVWLDALHSPASRQSCARLLAAGLLLVSGTAISAQASPTWCTRISPSTNRAREHFPGPGLGSASTLLYSSPQSAVAAAVFVVVGLIALARRPRQDDRAKPDYSAKCLLRLQRPHPTRPCVSRLGRSIPAIQSSFARARARRPCQLPLLSPAHTTVAGARSRTSADWSERVEPQHGSGAGDALHRRHQHQMWLPSTSTNSGAARAGLIAHGHARRHIHGRIVPEVHIAGTVAGRPLDASFSPTMDFGFGGASFCRRACPTRRAPRAAARCTAGPAPRRLTATQSGRLRDSGHRVGGNHRPRHLT